jgi:hypothetical protein
MLSGNVERRFFWGLVAMTVSSKNTLAGLSAEPDPSITVVGVVVKTKRHKNGTAVSP